MMCHTYGTLSSEISDNKVKTIVFSSLLGPLWKGRLVTPDPSSPETHAPVKLISPIPMIDHLQRCRWTEASHCAVDPRAEWPIHAAKALHILTSMSLGFPTIPLKPSSLQAIPGH